MGILIIFTFQYRPLLLDLLHYHNTVTYRELANKVQETLAEKPPRDTLLRLLKVFYSISDLMDHVIPWLQDLCVHKGTSKWTIKMD